MIKRYRVRVASEWHSKYQKCWIDWLANGTTIIDRYQLNWVIRSINEPISWDCLFFSPFRYDRTLYLWFFQITNIKRPLSMPLFQLNVFSSWLFLAIWRWVLLNGTIIPNIFIIELWICDQIFRIQNLWPI